MKTGRLEISFTFITSGNCELKRTFNEVTFYQYLIYQQQNQSFHLFGDNMNILEIQTCKHLQLYIRHLILLPDVLLEFSLLHSRMK